MPNNRHHAQRNIALHPVVNAMGQMKIAMFAGNPFDEGEDVFEIDVAVPEAEPGTLHVLDVVQRRGGEEVVGGGRLLLLTVDEKRYAGLHPERPDEGSSYRWLTPFAAPRSVASGTPGRPA